VSSSPAKLVAAPGMHIDDVVQRSTAALQPPAVTSEHGLMQPEDPHRLVVPDQRRGFELREGLFSLVETRLGTVQRLRSSPHLEYLDTDAAVSLLSSLSTTLARARWTNVQLMDEKALREALAESNEVSAGLWRADWWCIEITVRRAVEAGSTRAQMMQLDHDGYLVTLLLWDEQLLEQADSW
jgi:hypothetical protein